MTPALVRGYPHLLLASLCTGLAAANLARPGPPLAALAALTAVSAALAVPVLRIPLLALALLATGWWWGGARLEALDATVLAAHVNETARAVVVVTGPPRRGAFELRMPAQTRRFGRLDVREPVLLLLPRGRAPPQGGVLELIATVEEPRTSADGFDERAWLRRQGVAVVLDGAHWRAAGRRGGLGAVADRLRRHIEKTMAPRLEGERRAVIAGVVLGADEGLSPDLRAAFKASGLYHLLAVSGQNVVFIAIGVLAGAWLLGIPRRLAELAVLGAIGAYVLAVGWQPSVVRAGVSGGIASLAWLAARPRDRWYALLLGAAVLLAWSPYSLSEPGFQLSFVAVAAIFVGVPKLERALEGYPVPGRVGGVLAVSAVCGIATAPILWWRFGAIPVYSVPANAMAELSVGPMLGLGLVSSVLHPLLPSASIAIGWLDGWLAAYLAFTARLWASVPGAQITSPRPLAAGALVAAVALAGVRLVLGSRGR